MRMPFITTLAALLLLSPGLARSGELVLELDNAQDVKLVGAMMRWDEDGQHRRPVDPKAKIDAPVVDAQAASENGTRWVFQNLPPGRYDLVVLCGANTRIEGFHYPPVLEFDPFLPGDSPEPLEEDRDAILKDINGSRHYENKVQTLFMGGGDKQARVLMQLVRDLPTSFDGEFGAPVATVRHEIWQYNFRYGSWSKEKETVVLDRILMKRDEFAQWTWAWTPKLGGIEIGKQPVNLSLDVSKAVDPATGRGWFPD